MRNQFLTVLVIGRRMHLTFFYSLNIFTAQFNQFSISPRLSIAQSFMNVFDIHLFCLQTAGKTQAYPKLSMDEISPMPLICNHLEAGKWLLIFHRDSRKIFKE